MKFKSLIVSMSLMLSSVSMALSHEHEEIVVTIKDKHHKHKEKPAEGSGGVGFMVGFQAVNVATSIGFHVAPIITTVLSIPAVIAAGVYGYKTQSHKKPTSYGNAMLKSGLVGAAGGVLVKNISPDAYKDGSIAGNFVSNTFNGALGGFIVGAVGGAIFHAIHKHNYVEPKKEKKKKKHHHHETIEAAPATV